MKIKIWLHVLMINLYLLLITNTTYATIFVPVSELKDAASSGDWAQGVLKYAARIAGYLCYIIAVGGFFAVCSETIAAYRHAKQREQMGYFFAWAAIGLVLIAVIIGLVYGGNVLLANFPS